MKKIGLPLIFSLLVTACGSVGSGGPASLTLKYPGNDNLKMPVKSGAFYSSTKTWTKPGEKTTSSSNFVCIGDHEIDTSSGAISIGKKVEEGQTKVCFSIDGPKETKGEDPLAVDTYPLAKPSGGSFSYKSVSNVSIYTYQDGKEVRNGINLYKGKGQIKITSATADEISGEIEFSDDESSIKGTFTAGTGEK
ncbi:MAG: hypothetical protein HKN33_18930 [Pyrinomonadaceae bacterium]|nr:hypothetical protein [Pyrinomonadaceae bacterium]